MPRVLLVEHDPAARDRLALAMRHARFEVRSAGDAEGTRRILAEVHPQVVAVRADLPECGLPAFLDLLRATPGAAEAAVIALLPPGTDGIQAIRAALLAGADDALPHPVDADALIEAVRARERRLLASAPAPAAGALDAAPRVAAALDAMRRPATLAILELEDAAAIAATEGHEALRELDELWRARIRGLIPEQGKLFEGPLGEAIIILPPSTPQPRALLAALTGTGQSPVHVGGRELRLRASLGGLTLGRDEDTPPAEVAIARCRHAMRMARAGAHPRLHLYSPEDPRRALDDLQLATLLQHALEQGSFRLVFQPQVEMATGQVVGAEALIRWTLPTTGEQVSAMRLLAIAEDAGLLDEIGSWALREACRQCAAWAEGGLDLPVSVNIAASQFRRGDLGDEARMALSEAGIPGRLLTLEVQESVLATANAQLRDQVESLRVAGVRLSIDDFGTGIASIPLLRQLPVDELKIDQSVVARLPGAIEDRATLDVAQRHARALGIRCVAEGVEHAAQWACLAERGWDVAQGWYVGHPIAGRDIPGFVRRDPAALAAASGDRATAQQ